MWAHGASERTLIGATAVTAGAAPASETPESRARAGALCFDLSFEVNVRVVMADAGHRCWGFWGLGRLGESRGGMKRRWALIPARRAWAARLACWAAWVASAALWSACDRTPERPAGVAMAGAAAAPGGAGGPGSAGGPALAAPRWEHRFTPTAALDRMDAEVCFHGQVPPRLEPQTGRLREMISGIVAVHGGAARPLVMGERGIDLADLAPGDCVRYAVDLARATAPELLAYRRRTSGWRYGTDLMLSPDYYLLRPAGPLEHVTMTAVFDLPPGVQVLVPWPRLEPGGRSERGAQGAAPAGTAGPYRIPSTSFTWRIHGALGRFDIDVIEVAGARLRVAVLGQGWQVERGALLAWLREAAAAVAVLYQGFPEPEAQIIVLPTPGRRVAHGNAGQGGGPSIALMVGTEITAEKMRDDWVAVHELLHLGMPTVENGARWLSEGMATYYEPLLRARAGWITPRQAWEILHEGFQRGSKRGSGRTLTEESREMGETHEYWRVYWAGAAIAMIADVALRQHAGAPTLDEQMRAIRDCCLHSTRTWPAMALLAEVAVPPEASPKGSPKGSPKASNDGPPAGSDDRSPKGPNDVPDLASVAARYADAEAFPDLTATYAALGLRFDAQGRLLGTDEELAPEVRALRAALVERSPRDSDRVSDTAAPPGPGGSPAAGRLTPPLIPDDR